MKTNNIDFGCHIVKKPSSPKYNGLGAEQGNTAKDIDSPPVLDPLEYLNQTTRTLVGRGLPPKFWKLADLYREKSLANKKSRNWPVWCYLPTVCWMQDLFGHEQSLKKTVIEGTMSKTIEEAMAKPKGKDMYDSLMRYLYTIVSVGTWRLTKTVYDIDPVFFKELNHSKVNPAMKIPSEVMTRLPDWGVYVKFPDGTVKRPSINGDLGIVDGYSNHRTIARDRCKKDMAKHGKVHIPESDYSYTPIYGFFAFIDSGYHREVNDFYKARKIFYLNEDRFINADCTLVLAIDDGSTYSATKDSTEIDSMKLPMFEIYTLPLGDWTLEEALTPMVCWLNETDPSDPVLPELLKLSLKILEPYLNTVMYLCSDESDIRNRSTDKSLGDRKPRSSIPGKVTEWDVGKRIGSLFSKWNVSTGNSADDDLSSPTGLKVRPHWRRAHFHLYWTGKNRETPVVKWIEPTLINSSLDKVGTLPEVTRKVKDSCLKSVTEEYERIAQNRLKQE